jgi:hypothetical protein
MNESQILKIFLRRDKVGWLNISVIMQDTGLNEFNHVYLPQDISILYMLCSLGH